MKQVNLTLFAVVASLAASAPLNASEKAMITSTGLEMVWVPRGEFLMGSTAEERDWARKHGCASDLTKPEGNLRLTQIDHGFWLARTETTVEQWRKFVNATGYVTDAEKEGVASVVNRKTKLMEKVRKANWRGEDFGFALKETHPVSCVSWNDAVAFCEWLTKMEKATRKLPISMEYRLPTEAEWEFACRGHLKKMKFWWGDQPQDGEGRLNWYGTAEVFGTFLPVDHFGPRGRNGFGLSDMLGNVWEWCLDEFDPDGAHEKCFRGNPSGRPTRGGACTQFIAFERCATRICRIPNFAASHTGFRVCCGVKPSTDTKSLPASYIVTGTDKITSPAHKQNPTVKRSR